MLIVARRLHPLNISFAFVGGAVMYFLVDRPELTEFRSTDDVDVVTAVATYAEFAALEERLREGGFQHDTSAGAPICRWVVDRCRVDIMPRESASLDMNTRWFPEVLEYAVIVELGEGCSAKVVTPPLFLAMKLEAFKDRGKGDFYASHDLEDIVTLVDGRANIVAEMAAAPGEVRQFVAEEIALILKQADFVDALPGHLSGLLGARQRAPLANEKFEAIAAL